jgi:hypothetical protein
MEKLKQSPKGKTRSNAFFRSKLAFLLMVLCATSNWRISVKADLHFFAQSILLKI